MLAIIALHCTRVLELVKVHSTLSIALVTPFKFGTIGFFLISGFLLGERIDRCKPTEYLLRRFKRVFVPWSLWFGIMCAASVIGKRALHDPGYSNKGEMLWIAFSTPRAILFDSSFWFVPNLLFCIAILLICRHYLYSLKLGFALLVANLVYVANIYALWFPTSHTKALFGFVFYLWLGSYAAQNFERVSNFVDRISATALIATTLIAGIAAYSESHLLAILNRPDTLNTLRLSNQVFSISMVLLISKLGRATWPGFIDVRRHTFGLYLSHTIVLGFFMQMLRRCHLWMSDSIYGRDIEGVILWIVFSVACYISCLMITSWLARQPSLQWVIGLAPRDAKNVPSMAAVNVLDAHRRSAFPASSSPLRAHAYFANSR